MSQAQYELIKQRKNKEAELKKTLQTAIPPTNFGLFYQAVKVKPLYLEFIRQHDAGIFLGTWQEFKASKGLFTSVPEPKGSDSK